MPKVSTADRVARPEDDLHWVYHTSSSVLFICSLTCEQLSNDRVYMWTPTMVQFQAVQKREKVLLCETWHLFLTTGFLDYRMLNTRDDVCSCPQKQDGV